MSDRNEEPATNESNEPEQNTSLTDILRAVHTGQREAQKAHNGLIKRLEKLSKEISELGDRIDAADQSSQNPFAALFPTDTQLRITTQAQADGTPSLSLSMIQPQAQPQTQPVEAQAPPAATPDDTPNNDANAQAAAAAQPRRNPTRTKPTKNTPSTSANDPTLTSKGKAKPNYVYEDSITKRALDLTPPKITSARPLKPKVSRRGMSSAKGKGKGEEGSDDDDGVDEIPARADQHPVNGNKRNQQKPKHRKKTGHREANDDSDGEGVALDAEYGNDGAPAQTAMPSKKRKASHPDPVENAEGKSRVRAPGKVTSTDAHVDGKDEAQRPNKKKKGKKSKRSSESAGQDAK